MIIWLIQVGEPLPTDDPPPRMLRTGQFASHCADRNDQVVWWTSAFSHQTKKFRDRGSYEICTEKSSYHLEVVRALGYRGHTSIRRFLDEFLVALEIRRRSKKFTSPDVIVVSLPTISSVFAAHSIARRNSAKVIVDVRDLWPDILVQKLEGYWKVRLGRFVVSIVRYQLGRLLRSTDSIIGTSPMFVEWGQKLCRTRTTNKDATFPIAVERKAPGVPGPQLQNLIRSFDDKPFAIFAGSLVPQFDFSVVAEAARRNPQLHVLICGDGPLRTKLIESSPENFHVTGWLGQEELQWLLCRAKVGLAPYMPTNDFESNVPNKIVEYIASGLAIVSSLESGLVSELIATNQIGSNVPLNDLTSWSDALGYWCALGTNETSTLEKRCQDLYAQRFDAGEINSKMREHVLTIADA